MPKKGVKAAASMNGIWTRFVNFTETADDIKNLHPHIYESWCRSRSMNVDPWKPKELILAGKDIERRLKKNRMLLSAAAYYMSNLSSFLEGEQFSVVITDAEGIVLEVAGGTGRGMVQSKLQTYTQIGANRSESYVGTNTNGTCMVLDKPLLICGEEHYIKAHHIFSSSAAPLHHNGEIIGSLGMVWPKNAPHRHTFGMIVAAADGIEKEFQLRRAYDEIQRTNSQLTSILQSIDSGIIMIDNGGIIIQHNTQVCKILNLSTGSLSGKKLSDYLNIDGLETPLPHIEGNLQSRDVSVNLENARSVILLLTTRTINNARGIRTGTVLTFDVPKHVNRLVNQRSGFAARYTFDSIIGESVKTLQAKEMGKLASRRDSTVLILGESGTGKELYAQAIHNASERAAHPFIAINCGSLPSELVESELFGYVGGAFTGAAKEGQPGKFELADKGTVFLDEIGDMPLSLQTSLLRVLQSREITRIGGRKTIPVDVRIIAATNRDLEGKIRNNTFRSDLYYRLNVFPITLPALRERREDVRILVDHYIKTYKVDGITVDYVDDEALKILEQYDWPGNVRELQNIIERATNLARRNYISIEQLPAELMSTKILPGSSYSEIQAAIGEPGQPYRGYMRQAKETEREMLTTALTRTNGNISKAAQLLGISRQGAYNKIKEHAIDVSSFRLAFR